MRRDPHEVYARLDGRFDPVAARHAMQEMPERFLAFFLAMDRSHQQVCADCFNDWFARNPARLPGWRLTKG